MSKQFTENRIVTATKRMIEATDRRDAFDAIKIPAEKQIPIASSFPGIFWAHPFASGLWRKKRNIRK